MQILTEFPEIGYHYRREPEGDIRVILYGHYRATQQVISLDFYFAARKYSG